MPTTRRSANNGPQTQGKQSTLSFNHRVTKSGASKQSAKDNLSKSITSSLSSTTPAVKQSPLSKQVKSEEEKTKEEEEEERHGLTAAVVAEIPAPTEEEEVKSVKKVVGEEEKNEKSEVELKALKITDRQVETYWKDVESQRIAKRVHQEDLSVAEKVLRYFDVSSQYGPCIGITRRKRWERAERLGLQPPVEVLAVLLRDGEGMGKKTAGKIGGGKGVRETAHMDDILNSTAVGAS